MGVLAVFIQMGSLSSHAVTIIDTYIGGDDHHHGDVIGNVANFDTLSMDVSLSGSLLTVSINTNFAGQGDNGLFSGVTRGMGIGYGDLFLSSSWTPHGSAPYMDDNASTGTVWSYGFSIDNHWMNENDAGSGTLYSLNSGDNNADIHMSEDFLTGATYRNGQEVAVDTVNGNVTALNNGTWDIDVANNRVNFQLDLSVTSLLLPGSDIVLHWGPSCGNDVIEGVGVSAVPVPAAVWLFGSGLIGLVVVARRR